MELAARTLASNSLVLATIVLELVAVVGVIGSFMIQRVPSANPTLAFPWNPILYSWRDMKLVLSDRPILRVTLGIAFFWSLASLAQMNIDVYVTGELEKSQTEVGIFLAVLSLGVGLGSVLAGWWSGGRVELGMVPFGALLMALACVLLCFSQNSSVMAGAMLGMIGVGGGLFNVPLNAWLQERSPHEKLGAILAAGNQLTSLGMVAVAGLFWLLTGPLTLSASQIFLVTGLGILPILLYVVWLLPQATVRFFVWLLSRFVYRVRIYDVENLPENGPGLLVANYVSWLDGVLLLLSSSRPIRMVAYADYVKVRWIGWLARLFGIIPIRSGDGPRALMQSLNAAREALQAGELVCIFAEGQITRNGQLQKFERGLVKILKGTDAPVIPVYLDELWGSIFSYERGKLFWKKPSHWPYPVSISFGAPIHGVNDVDVVRHAVLDLSVKSMERRKDRRMIPAKQFIRQCRVAWRRTKTADSAGTELTGGKLLTGSLALHKLLTSSVLKPNAQFVGLLLPPSAGGVLANAIILMATPTFLRSYLKRCTAEEMRSLNLVIVAAEKLPDDLRDAFREKYGFEPSEGYGTTELSPIAAVNIPASRLGGEQPGQTSTKHGTVGRVIPGSVAAVFHPETNERLGTNQEGMLKIKGPNVMLGYLNHPEKTAELIQDGWYTTGDLGMIDDDGFIRITGRQSRFSKIGGEMVPHIRIEQEIARIIEDTPNDEAEIICAITAVPDSAKGERLIVLHKPLQKSIREIMDRLQQAGLPNLWIPSYDSFLEVNQIPLLGTGKLDLRGIKDMAMNHYAVK